ncbi:MAG: NAD-binding protein [Candidatus Helarchaeota archaeon]
MNLIKSSGIKDLILIGYTNVAKRLINQLENEKISYKLIERNSKKVKNFHNKEDLIVGDAKDIEILKKAGIPKIELVIVLIDNPEEVLLIADAIRELNKNCNLICRFFHEEVAEILVKEPFKAQIISQSKKALEELINMGVFDF